MPNSAHHCQVSNARKKIRHWKTVGEECLDTFEIGPYHETVDKLNVPSRHTHSLTWRLESKQTLHAHNHDLQQWEMDKFYDHFHTMFFVSLLASFFRWVRPKEVSSPQTKTNCFGHAQILKWSKFNLKLTLLHLDDAMRDAIGWASAIFTV